jgi:hypothetical protein
MLRLCNTPIGLKRNAVPHTGLIYSARKLAPALAICAI